MENKKRFSASAKMTEKTEAVVTRTLLGW